MAEDSFKRLVELQKRLRRQLEPLSASIKALQADSGVQRLIEDAQRHQALIRAALGPFEELRRSGVLGFAGRLDAEYRQVQEMIAAQEKRFHLPEVAEAVTLLREFEESGAAPAIKQFHQQQSEFQRAMESMRAPWLDMENRVTSLTGFIELQGIGYALRTMPAFDSRLADRLRIDLGDWRAKINWPDAIFTDPLARTTFYAGRGLDLALTAFPANAFDQSVTIAGIKRPSPPLIAPYQDKPEADEDDEESGLMRNNAAHDRLQRFESQFRKFIDERMTTAFGVNWVKHRVHSEIYEAWRNKQQKAKDGGEPDRPLIAYADFTDYERIIVRNDNWPAVFRQFFGRKTLVQESLQRLYPVRVCTMHSRIITQADELYLYAETKRLLAAIGIFV